MDLTGRPEPPGPSPWDGLPEKDHAEPAEPVELPVAVGGVLTPATLVGAYRRGLFPFPVPVDDPIEVADTHRRLATAVADGRVFNLSGDGPPDLDFPWWCPDPRGVLPVGAVHVSDSLFRRMRACAWTTTLDEAFAEVVRGCSRGGRPTWITPELADAYRDLHRLGWAHSVEVWQGEDLIGGMFGVLVGAAFMAESMFHVQTDASKVALVDFDVRFVQAGGRLIDAQFVSAHAGSMGAVEIPRERFLAVLRDVRDTDVWLVRDRMPVTRLVERARAARRARRAMAVPPPAARGEQ
ncbi:leucyl/phenylalanyl-tRNA--protein transferase [Frankia sp. Cas3]|uniref:leucyl/phenylalanyl-tRNA--protein transferase n=1 Tax=Frankia sp. Cas3 TaxID=3073926 RepID=UPI002AD2A2EE|nr:leucyl/phenylalanyl-tRNA--protein transferase [Frankia sp. Cas3]